MDAGITESNNSFVEKNTDINNNQESENHELENHEAENHEPENHEPKNHEPENHEPENHEPENHDPENHEAEYHEPENHEPVNHEPENHEPEKQAHFEQQNTQINDYHLEDVVPQVYTKPGFIQKLKDFFRKKSQVELRRESKWRKVRTGTGNQAQKIEHFKEKVENKQILNEIGDSVKEITINKTELIWLLDNIHSNGQIIKKLQRRQSQFDGAMESVSGISKNSKTSKNSKNSGNTGANSSADSKLKVRQIMDRLNSQIDELQTEKEYLQFDKTKVQENLNLTSLKLNECEAEVSRKNGQISDLKLDLELMQQAFDSSAGDFHGMAKNFQRQLQHAI